MFPLYPIVPLEDDLQKTPSAFTNRCFSGHVHQLRHDQCPPGIEAGDFTTSAAPAKLAKLVYKSNNYGSLTMDKSNNHG